MEIISRFYINAISDGECTAIDFSYYSYVMKLCMASGTHDVIHIEPEAKFSTEGESLFHHMKFLKYLEESPLVYCDVYSMGICTDKNILIKSFSNENDSNDWTVYYKKYSTALTTKNPDFVKLCNISNNRVFIDHNFPVGDKNDPFEKSKIERQLSERLKYKPSFQDFMVYPYPYQGEASLCGPAVLFYTLLADRPDLYSKFIKNLWNNGKSSLGTLTVTPSEGCCHPKYYTEPGGETRIPAIDWISMASLRDDENIFFDYQSPDDKFSGVTMPEGIIKLVKALCAAVIFHDMSLFSWPKYKVVQLSEYVESTKHVAVLINHGMLYGTESGYPTHWVVFEDRMRNVETNQPIDEYTPDDAMVDVKLFSWGEVKNMSEYSIGTPLPFKKICSYIYGVVVFDKIP